MSAILASNVTKIYGSKRAVNAVDLNVPKGEIYGFLGRNGAGKSTFINMITGIIHPTEGSVQILGSEDRNAILSRIGVLPDYTAFYESLTALQHVQYFSALQGRKRSKAECLDALDKVGLLTHAKQKVGKFSFGMKKKLGIAQAIINEPELLILDEPTSGLDPESGLQIQRLIVTLNKKGTTIFMTSHNLAEIEKICTRIAIMKDGIIVNEGTIAELQTKYTETLHVSMKITRTPDETLLTAVEDLTGPIELNEGWIHFIAKNDDEIGEVVKLFVQAGIAVHRISANQPNLEDIFLSE